MRPPRKAPRELIADLRAEIKKLRAEVRALSLERIKPARGDADQCLAWGISGICTRSAGHRGRHVAHNIEGKVIETWTDADTGGKRRIYEIPRKAPK